MRNRIWMGCVGMIVLGLMCVGVALLPPVQQRLGWRIANLQTQLFYLLNPPDQVALDPSQPMKADTQATVNALVATLVHTQAVVQTAAAEQTQAAQVSTAESAAALDAVTAAAPTATLQPTITATPSPSATPLPGRVALTGIRHEWQSFNNCGPANTAMMLSFWGWQGDQHITKAVLRPSQDDANVMPEEIAEYVNTQTDLRALVRVGGSLERLKQLTAAGFPVLIEMGHDPSDDWWMGHYVVISGYDDDYAALISQDSLIVPDLPIPYHELETQWWRDFNRLYLVVYAPEREAELLALLGADADPQENLRRTLEAAQAEIPSLSGRDQFFARYNQGAALLALGQPDAAATAFDLAFAQYRSLDEEQRPWRVLWYRTEAYQAYHAVGRYQSVIDLTNATLSMLNKRSLEESHYWRGMAYEALGERDKALADYQIAVQMRPAYAPAQQALARMGG